MHGQPGRLILEVPREPRGRPGPRDRGHHDPVLLTMDPWRGRLDEHLHDSQVQAPPSPPAGPLVVVRAALPTPGTAPARPFRGSRRHHQRPVAVLEFPVFDDDPLDTEQSLPYALVGHPGLPRSFVALDKPRSCTTNGVVTLSRRNPTHGTVRRARVIGWLA